MSQPHDEAPAPQTVEKLDAGRREYVDVTADTDDRLTQIRLPSLGHNTSKQDDVQPSPDLALHISHEHQHQHTHHSRASEAGRQDEPVYSTNTTFDRSSIPDQSPEGHDQNHRKSPLEKDVTMYLEDEERGGLSATRTSQEEENLKSRRISTFLSKYRLFIHLAIWLVFTGWWIAGLILHRYDPGWLIPFLLYLAITLRLIFFHVPITVVTKPMHYVWKNTGVRAQQLVPQRLRIPAAGFLTFAVMCAGAFASEESADNTRANRAVSLFGLLVILFVLWATSRDRSKIKWHTVFGGMLTQFIIALFVLRSGAGYDIFSFISGLARDLLGFANQGTAFLTDADVPDLGWFLVGVVPPIIFFVALVQLMYHVGLIQWFVGKFAVFFFWSLRVSGAEAVVAAASPFIGQGESAMLIRPFVPHLTRAELHQVMTSGFATISGSVLVAYISLGLNAQALVSSCIMSIPASLAISKLRHPETEETLTAGRVVVPDDDEHRSANALHAFAQGAWLGLKIAGMIVATLLCIIALLGLINGLLTWWGHYLSIYNPDLTLQLILGYLCYPIAFLLGVPRNGDLLKVAELIGVKVVANEFVAFKSLTSDPNYLAMSPRSKLIATYALCGFGNFGSLGTQIGVLSQIAPGRSGDVSRVALSALFSGVLSTLTSASIAGMLVTDQAVYTTTRG